MIRALSLRQPWAHSVIHDGKSVENRTWRTRYRGILAIHAARTLDPVLAEVAEVFTKDLPLSVDEWLVEVPRGAFVGFAELVGIHHADDDQDGPCSEWAEPGVFHWELRNPVAIEPVEFAGAQGVFPVPRQIADLAARVYGAKVVAP